MTDDYEDWDEPTRARMLNSPGWRWGNDIRTYAYDICPRSQKRKEERERHA